MTDTLPWTIQITFDRVDDDGKKHRTRSVLHVDASNIGTAYEIAKEMMGPGYKLGAIMAGHQKGIF